MVDSEPKQPLTPEVVDDVSAGFGVPGDNRQHAHQDETTLRVGPYYNDDHEYRSRRGGDRGVRDGDGEDGMRQMNDDDPHGNAARALTALSSGVGDHVRSSSCSGFQGFVGGQQSAPERDLERSQSERRENMMPSYSERPLLEAQEAFADATKGEREGSQQQNQRQHITMRPLALHLPLSAGMTPSLSSSALNISALTASESTSPISAQEEVIPLDTIITPQEQYAPYAPGERMQSLSHMLKDRLSLASLRTERGWDRIDMDVSEKKTVKEVPRQLMRRDDYQQYHDYYDRSLTSHQEFVAHSSRFMRVRPGTPPMYSTALQQGHDGSEEMRRQQWDFSHDNHSQHPEQRLQLRPQLHQKQQDQEQQQQHRVEPSNPIQDDSSTSHWIAHISPSPTMDPIAFKSKRKYTKKSSLDPQAMFEGRNLADFQLKQENNELLYSDRGLILKTQIPKKGRPISKHSTTSSQNTPTLTSLGNLPASHHYFNKTGSPSTLDTRSTWSRDFAHQPTPRSTPFQSNFASSYTFPVLFWWAVYVISSLSARTDSTPPKSDSS
ncbi:hypothetical protein BGZ96_012471 [Linnemannia gamsii]|uniref:Uncharacterized protein n=1 Tax=Linnemannia gamsii TaxID=64522 RepID=A0ABQ7JQD6_9FUNG|nr:hypothetical protein BGZ96_012471 [Linnemannia gamsii]